MQRDWTSSSSESSLHHQPLLGFRVLGFRRAGLRAGAGEPREKKSVDEDFVCWFVHPTALRSACAASLSFGWESTVNPALDSSLILAGVE
jgi:hypothetical protein